MTHGIEIWTVGHSNRRLDEFVRLIQAHRIEALADVRRFPGSRRYPHFCAEALARELGTAGVEYHAFRELGGRRGPRADSPNIAWRNDGFRGYADYMESQAFRAAIDQLLSVAKRRRTAIACAEALWWRCHRSLISDYLKAQGHIVSHIHTTVKTELHPFTTEARMVGGRLTYGPAPGEYLFE